MNGLPLNFLVPVAAFLGLARPFLTSLEDSFAAEALALDLEDPGNVLAGVSFRDVAVSFLAFDFPVVIPPFFSKEGTAGLSPMGLSVFLTASSDLPQAVALLAVSVESEADKSSLALVTATPLASALLDLFSESVDGVTSCVAA